MNWYRNLNFRQKLVIPSVVLIFIIVVSSAVGIRNVSKLETDATLLAEQLLPNQDYLLQADKDLVQVQTAERSIIHLKPGSDQFKDQKRLQEINLQQAYDRVNKIRSDNKKLLSLKSDFLVRFSAWKTATQRVTQAMLEGSNARAEQISFGEANNQFWQLRDLLDEVMEVIISEKDQAMAQVHSGVKSTYSVLLASTVITLAICAFFVFGLPSMVMRSIAALSTSIEDITKRDGDLTKRVEVTSHDELGALGSGFNRFLDNLHGIISEVVGSTGRFGDATHELQGVSVSAKAGLEQQKQATQNVARATREMSDGIEEMASQALQAADEAKQANENASLGQNVILQTIGTINDLSKEVTSAEASVNRLAEDSQNIGSVLDVIETIADQTNLLALNAAIEAARAGEQGRGFAVVADEVRSLAAKTQQSTEEIKIMIDKLRAGSSEAVQAIAVSNQKMLESVDVVRSAEEALSSIAQSISFISTTNQQIANSAEYQRRSTEEINRFVGSISEESNNSLKNAEAVARSSESLASLSSGLQGLVGSFKL